jgi:3-hydroxybutyryl-CoA dehydrogenase
MEIKKIGVIGAGTMGHGIALVSARSGYGVVMSDIEEKLVNRGIEMIGKILSRNVEKGKMSEEEKEKAQSRIKATTKTEDMRDCDIVVEAVIESIDLKKRIFTEVDGILKPQAILASNTSTIPITEMAAVTRRPERFIGMHFMNPVPVMKLVEVIRGLATSDETTKIVVELAERMDKVPIEVNDYPGFVSNRVLMPMINEAVYCLMEGVATAEAIDGVMKLGMNHPMGPLALADLIGLDTCLNIMNVLYDGFSDSKYRPCPLLRKMVSAGYLGQKTGRGFYDYKNSSR